MNHYNEIRGDRMRYAMVATWKMAYEGVCKSAGILENDCEEALTTAIQEVERNPAFHSVGLGGLPDKTGKVTLDGAFMDGKTLQVGAVAGIENTYPFAVAKHLSRKPFNNILAGQGATEYALDNGFEQVDLLTEEAYEKYKERKDRLKHLCAYDGHDTVCMIALDQSGHMCVGTSTSGLFMKESGRVGDSPLCGCGFYCDEEIGGAVATGMGEEILRGVLSYDIVNRMKQGFDPQTAADDALNNYLERLKRANKKAKAISLLCMDNLGNFGVATTVEFAFVVTNEHQEPVVYYAMKDGNKTIYKEYEQSDGEID